MKSHNYFFLSIFLIFSFICQAQEDSSENRLVVYQQLIKQSKLNSIADSIKKSDLLQQIELLKENEKLKKEKLISEIKAINGKDSLRQSEMLRKVDDLKKSAIGYPVAPFSDTLFFVYIKVGESIPQERANNISEKIKRIYGDNLLIKDSMIIVEAENSTDIQCGEIIVMSISEMDALWNKNSKNALAGEYAVLIENAIIREKEKVSIFKILTRIGLVLLVIAGIWILVRFIGKGHKRTESYIIRKKDKWLKDLSYNDYTYLTVEKELKLIQFSLKLFKWFVIILSLYLFLPSIFSIFPFTRGWANILFDLIWSPFKGLFIAIWDFLPNLFTILVIYFVFKYFIRFVKYIFNEIESEKLKISGFHADWALPTFSIVRFLLYAFMFVLIFPYLPGSDSNVFKGVSVFIGVLFSLGSSSAIGNMIAGIVITYMRPFKIGDRIKIGDISGDVIEKTMLVTRLRTTKNEEITIPNSTILSGNTINYSTNLKLDGLILHTTITIGYEIPWQDIHQSLIDAAMATDLILQDPKPFVLQTSLDDFYVSYQINAYTRDSNKQAIIYSDLHKNIQDVFNKKKIEIMSPHYRALRDGNMTTVPADYIDAEYIPPTFKVDNINK